MDLVLYVTLLGMVLAVAAAVSCHREAGGRPLTFPLLVETCSAWCAVLCFPAAMALGNFAASWPYGHDYPISLHKFRWDVQVAYGFGGLVVASVLGMLLAVLIQWGRYAARPNRPAPPDPGPRWSDRPGAQPPSNTVRPALDGLTAGDGTDAR
jgi:hypothetical protein